jgi:hypothetical protein
MLPQVLPRNNSDMCISLPAPSVTLKLNPEGSVYLPHGKVAAIRRILFVNRANGCYAYIAADTFIFISRHLGVIHQTYTHGPTLGAFEYLDIRRQGVCHNALYLVGYLLA